MDSSLEEEIARLSRPPTAENAEPIPALPPSSISNVTVMPRPVNNAAALQQQAREDAAAPPSGANRLRRGSSGSSSGDLSRSGSGRQRSPQRAAGRRSQQQAVAGSSAPHHINMYAQTRKAVDTYSSSTSHLVNAPYVAVLVSVKTTTAVGLLLSSAGAGRVGISYGSGRASCT